MRAMANLRMVLAWQTGDAGLERPFIGGGTASGECPMSESGIASRLPSCRSRVCGLFHDAEIDHQDDLRTFNHFSSFQSIVI